VTSRERVLAVLSGEIPDRVPIILGVSNATGIKMGTYRGLCEILGCPCRDRYIYDWPELGTALPEEEVLRRLRTDVRGILDRFPKAVYERNAAREPHTPFIDDWGTGQKEIEPGVWFPGIHPLADASRVEEVSAYKGWPDMDDPYRVAHVSETAKTLADEGQYAILATPWLLFPLERAFALQGMDNFLVNLSLEPEFATALLKKNLSLCKALMAHFLDALGPNVDMIKIGDDMGSQEGLLMSPDMYRRILKPIHAELIQHIRERTDARVFFHTDGDVFDLVDDLVEIGVDVLNPIQTSAGRMADLAAVKKRFGGRLVLCGGVDTQRILPFGSPAEVAAEVKRVIDLLGPGGGYMLASVHTIMNEVPPENVLAMVDAVVEHGRYTG
jgi:uroporphyrinogen decarboxylase